MRPLLPLAGLLLLLAACGDGNDGSVCAAGAPCTCDDGTAGVCEGGACTCAPVSLEVEPPILDFGAVGVVGGGERMLRLANPGAAPVRLRRAVVEAGADTFRVGRVPEEIPPGAVAPLPVSFVPSAPGTTTGSLAIEPVGGEPIRVELRGVLPGGVFECPPVSLEAYPHVERTQLVTCRNLGLADPEPLAGDAVVQGLRVEGSLAFAVEPRASPGTYAPGQSYAFAVTFDGQEPGTYAATAVLETLGGPVRVSLRATVAPAPPCELDHLALVDLGALEPGEVRTRDVVLVNRREDAGCRVSDVRLAPFTDPAWSLEPLAQGWIPPLGRLLLPLGCAADRWGTFAGELLFAVEDPALPERSIRLRAANPGPVRIEPTTFELGAVHRGGVADRSRGLELRNVGSSSHVIRSIEVVPPSADLTLVDPPANGELLEPGVAIAFGFRYRPLDEGPDAGTIRLDVEGMDEPVTVTWSGTGLPPSFHTDEFQQNEVPKADVLVVIDNGTSMAARASRLVAELGPLPELLAAKPIDYRLAVTTTGLAPAPGAGCPGGVDGGEDGRFFPVVGTGPRVITPATPDGRAAWEANLAVGACQHAAPQGIEAALRALTPPLSTEADDPRHPEPDDGNLGFLRPDAALDVIFVTDRADASPVRASGDYNGFQALKGFRNTHLLTVHAITGDPGTGCTGADGASAEPGDRLVTLASFTEGGLFRSICEGGWLDGPEFAPFGLKSCFFIGNQPEDLDGDGILEEAEGELEVRVDGVVVPSSGPQGPNWSYDPSMNAFCFHPDRLPPPGSAVAITYVVGCSH